MVDPGMCREELVLPPIPMLRSPKVELAEPIERSAMLELPLLFIDPCLVNLFVKGLSLKILCSQPSPRVNIVSVKGGVFTGDCLFVDCTEDEETSMAIR